MSHQARLTVAASVRDCYDRWAADYDRDVNSLPTTEEPEMRTLLGGVDRQRAVDLGFHWESTK